VCQTLRFFVIRQRGLKLSNALCTSNLVVRASNMIDDFQTRFLAILPCRVTVLGASLLLSALKAKRRMAVESRPNVIVICRRSYRDSVLVLQARLPFSSSLRWAWLQGNSPRSAASLASSCPGGFRFPLQIAGCAF
jgi:hypothetical protein